MRILFVTSSRIGDAVLSTGLLDHLIRTYPRARFTVCCGPAAEGVFLRMPNLERLIVFDKVMRGLHWLPLWAKVVGSWWFMVVDIRASALAWLVPTLRRRVMRRRAGHKTAQLAAVLGVSPPPLPVAWTSDADRALAGRLLPEGGPVIALGPTANWDGKVWPPERFVELARRIAGERLPGARFAVFAGPGEYEARLAAPVLAALPEAIDLTGRLALPEAAACLARCTIFIGNDSGLMHLAASAGCPTLGLFGPTPAPEYAPAGARAAAAVARGSAMADLGVEDALAAAGALLA
jgi:ADP-heptose:LPS heptosyltransferase